LSYSPTGGGRRASAYREDLSANPNKSQESMRPV